VAQVKGRVQCTVAFTEAMAPSTLLYSAFPIVPDQTENEQASTKLSVEVAEKTLGLIEEVLESTKVSKKQVKKSVRARDTVSEYIKSRSFGFFTVVAFLAVLVIGVVDIFAQFSAYAP
jgi:hypothetical protein